MHCHAKARECTETERFRALSFQKQVIIRKIYVYQVSCNIALMLTLLSWFLPDSIALRLLLACSFWCLHVMTTYAEMIIFMSLFFLSQSCILK
jgi:hypothetical protein